ncbi:hypothetical protein DO97_02785 [Neosynechococcus sphagnicola sy1]|uniref:Uncharacterized protein n=1 Tax=Neosynechococcus sphagnicola sy1 TaxID=1497020 RepID=A0A098TKZ5_9CYAN|nr:hypothetical protein [Neosynechococcus sphagnicola]KGF72995.1 hypothetical protein DO97_02785 [Neosynechococcus sphagnicola sy1]
MNETEGQDIERQLTSQELEGIAGGFWDEVGDFFGKVGGGIVAGLSEVGKGEMKRGYMATGDYAGTKEIDAKYPSMSDVYNSAKDTVGAKIGGGSVVVAGVAGAIYAGGSAVAGSLSTLGAVAIVAIPLSQLTSRNNSSGSVGSMPKPISYGSDGVPIYQISSVSSSISGLQINEQSPIGEQLVGNTVNKFCSAELLQKMGIPDDARVVGYVSAKDADANFVKEFKADSGLNDNAKLGYLQVDYSINSGNNETLIVHKNVPLIDLGNTQQNNAEETKPATGGIKLPASSKGLGRISP